MPLQRPARQGLSYAPAIILCGLLLCGLLLLLAPPALAQEPEPVETVPAGQGGTGGTPSPDPAPAPEPPPPPAAPPPASPPPAAVSPPVYNPPPAVSQPTQQQTEAEKRREREEARRRREEERRREEARQRREAEQAIREAHENVNRSGALPAGVGLPPPPQVPEVQPEPAETVTPEPAGAEVSATPVAQVTPAGGVSEDSSLQVAAPILLGLFGLAVVLLGLAAVPPWHVHGSLGGLLLRRRLELGLIGTAVLASAAIGLIVALVAG